jgi:hypothetical protein
MDERDDGWTFIGHAVVTFAEGSSQAYMNVLKHGHEFRADFITLATPQPSPSP